MLYYTVYKTTNKINGKIYVGAHKTKDLDDGYLGSGLHLGYAIEKYGIENFEKEIIAVFDKSSEMFEMESTIVNEDFIADAATYNLKLGGHGGFDYINNQKKNIYGENGQSGFGLENLTIGRETQKWFRKNDPAWVNIVNENFSKARKKYFADGGINGFRDKKHTKESKAKIGASNAKYQKGSGNSQYGKMWIYNLELKESKRILKNDLIPEGWIKGRKIKF